MRIPKPVLKPKGEQSNGSKGVAKKMKRNVFLVKKQRERVANDKIGTVEPQKTNTEKRSEHFSNMNIEKEKEKMLLISSSNAVVYPTRVKEGAHSYGQ